MTNDEFLARLTPLASTVDGSGRQYFTARNGDLYRLDPDGRLSFHQAGTGETPDALDVVTLTERMLQVLR